MRRRCAGRCSDAGPDLDSKTRSASGIAADRLDGEKQLRGETSGNQGFASGVYGKAINDYAIGVTGRNTGGGTGVYGWSNTGPGVHGTSDDDYGVDGVGKCGGWTDRDLLMWAAAVRLCAAGLLFFALEFCGEGRG